MSDILPVKNSTAAVARRSLSEDPDFWDCRIQPGVRDAIQRLVKCGVMMWEFQGSGFPT